MRTPRADCYFFFLSPPGREGMKGLRSTDAGAVWAISAAALIPTATVSPSESPSVISVISPLAAPVVT